MLTTRKPDRVFGRLVRQPDHGEELASAGLGLPAIDTFHPYWRGDDVLQHSHVGEEVEALEHHADPLARSGDLTLRHARSPAAAPVNAVADRLAVYHDRPVLVLLEQVGAAQQGGLARTARADHDDDLAGADRERYVAQYLDRTKALA